MQTGNFLDSWCVIEVKLGFFDSILVIHFSRDYNIAVKKIWDYFVQMHFFSSPLKKIAMTSSNLENYKTCHQIREQT